MKRLGFILIAGILFCMEGYAQVSFKIEYIGNSGYYYMPSASDHGEKIGNSEGSAFVYQGTANIPFYMKRNENNRLTAWGVGLGGAYVSLNNKNFAEDMVSEIMNLQFGIFHIRPLNDNWSMMANIGVGVFTPFTDFSKIRVNHLLGSGGIIFIRHFANNLDIGLGLTLNNTVGLPMVFPAFYLNWYYKSKFNAKVTMGDGIELSAGYGFNDYFMLSLAFEMYGQIALLERDEKEMVFTHQYMVTGLRPEIKFGKTGISMPFMAGINVVRPAFYNDRSLKGRFETNGSYYFRISPYASVSIRYGLY